MIDFIKGAIAMNIFLLWLLCAPAVIMLPAFIMLQISPWVTLLLPIELMMGFTLWIMGTELIFKIY